MGETPSTGACRDSGGRVIQQGLTGNQNPPPPVHKRVKGQEENHPLTLKQGSPSEPQQSQVREVPARSLHTALTVAWRPATRSIRFLVHTMGMMRSARRPGGEGLKKWNGDQGPFPLTCEATSFVDLTETLGAGLEMPWEVWGYATRRAVSSRACWVGSSQAGRTQRSWGTSSPTWSL